MSESPSIRVSMEVRLFPNPRRPGIGLRPRREAQRPHLPQHARHCPVLEAGSALGFLVYPPLGEHESFNVSFEGEGLYRFVYSVNPNGAGWQEVLSVTHQSRELALLMFRMFIAVEDLGTPAGAVTLRGAWNFQTPTGWDTVYTPIF